MKNQKKLQVDIAFIFIEFYNRYLFIDNIFSKKKKVTIRADLYARKVINLLKKYEKDSL